MKVVLTIEIFVKKKKCPANSILDCECLFFWLNVSSNEKHIHGFDMKTSGPQSTFFKLHSTLPLDGGLLGTQGKLLV